ncbi:hypothetical protein [Salinibaculum salinum]|uniref:hypothetical protein n=1 Tax=Salinibaculum salinum TaxID=3131996 RepID=UPI0030EB3FAE
MDGLPRGWLVAIALAPSLSPSTEPTRADGGSWFDPDWDPSRPVGGLSTPHTALVASVVPC